MTRVITLENGYLHLRSPEAVKYVENLIRTGALYEELSNLVENKVHNRDSSGISEATMQVLIHRLSSELKGRSGGEPPASPALHVETPTIPARTEPAVLKKREGRGTRRSGGDMLARMEQMSSTEGE